MLPDGAGFPFPIGPNFVRQTIRYEVRAQPARRAIRSAGDGVLSEGRRVHDTPAKSKLMTAISRHAS
jgi:hypothetical protein